MGTLGTYLREARESLGIDLRNAAQQTRISMYYLKALEEQEFSKLPGEVFVKGFLKNYGRFLLLDEAEVMKKYIELKPQTASEGRDTTAKKVIATVAVEQKPSRKTAIEPFIWSAGILIALVLFFFIALPPRHPRQTPSIAVPSQAIQAPPVASLTIPEKLYLKVEALENTWILIRTDNGPQKKAVLQKGESLIWSADERFHLSYGSAGALMLSLNGRKLTVNEPRNTSVRDLTVTASGIVNRKIPPEHAKPIKPKPQPETVLPQQVQPSSQ